MRKSKWTNFDDLPLVLTVPELMEVLNINKGAAYELVRSKQIASVKINKTIRINKEEVIKYIRGNDDEELQTH